MFKFNKDEGFQFKMPFDIPPMPKPPVQMPDISKMSDMSKVAETFNPSELFKMPFELPPMPKPPVQMPEMPDLPFNMPEMPFSMPDFKNCDLKNCSFKDIDLKKLDPRNIDFDDIDLKKLDPKNVDLKALADKFGFKNMLKGFDFKNMDWSKVPVQKLLSIEATPQQLEKFQGVLDKVFNWYLEQE